MAEKPEGWREVTLGEILTDAQLAEMMKKIRQLKADGVKPFDLEYTQALKELFAPWRADLEAKGVLPDYLAYLVTYLIHKGEIK